MGDVARIASGALSQAAELGDMQFIQWLLLRYIIIKEDTCHDFAIALNAACRTGRLAAISWLLMFMKKTRIKFDPSEAMFTAAKYGKLAVVQYLYATFSRDASLDLFQVQSKEFRLDESAPATAMDVAASNGHLDILQFLHGAEQISQKRHKVGEGQTNFTCRQDLRCSTTAMNAAAANGHLSVVVWLHGNRSEGCTSLAMDRAAANGHLEMVQWLSCSRPESCTATAIEHAAARHFHTDIGLHHELPTCCAGLAPDMFYEKQFALVKWLHSRSPVGLASTAMDSAASNGDLKLLQWLHENTQARCTTKAMDTAAANGRLDIVERLNTNRWEGCTTAAMDDAAAGGHLHVVKWLYANRSEGCTARAMDGAAEKGQLRVVRWLHLNCTGARVETAMSRALDRNEFEVALRAHSPNLAAVENLSTLKNNLAIADCVEARHPERPVAH